MRTAPAVSKRCTISIGFFPTFSTRPFATSMPAFSASSRATPSGPGLLNEKMVHFPFDFGKQLRVDTANEGIAYCRISLVGIDKEATDSH